MPNNDTGSEIISNKILYYKKIKNENFKIIRSMRFEYYLSLLKHSNFIVGNSSSGVMEAPYYGVPTIDLGSRQKNRAKINSIFTVNNFQKLDFFINKFQSKNLGLNPSNILVKVTVIVNS